jgi:hypothetical protein
MTNTDFWLTLILGGILGGPVWALAYVVYHWLERVL